jgi:hypothetical protein
MNSAIIERQNSVSKLTSQLDFILLDGSGSMRDKWWDMLGAIDTYVSTLKTNAVDSHLLLHIFDDHDLRLVGRDTHIRDWKTFNIDPIGAHFGGTPLYDAIVMMGATIRDLNPSACAITIVTDGENGHNKFASLDQATAILDWLRAQGFQVTFIGCDFNNSAQARALGANDSNSIGVQKKLLSAAARNYAEKRTANARTGADISFSETERQQFGGYLTSGGN